MKRRAKSRPYGPPVLRKRLYLAALTVKHRTGRFERYYLRKRAEGNPARLVLNNIANKLVRIICAVLREGEPYYDTHRSVNPALLQKGRAPECGGGCSGALELARTVAEAFT